MQLQWITVIPMPYKDTTSALGLRKRKVKDVQLPETVIPQKTAMEWLQWGKQSRRHETAGWLKNALVHYQLLEDNPFAVWNPASQCVLFIAEPLNRQNSLQR